MVATPPWWRTGVVYQIYPRSFADANGDGVGDLAGIRQRVDHLSWLGVDAVWLSPIFRSPMADFGYDVADYRDVDPVFGDLDELDRLIEELHGAGIRLLLDWVPNHTSDQHQWFVEARSSREADRRDWYIWRDPAPDGGPPNNWTRHFADEPAWTFDEATGQYYLHLFLPQQPDLNWANPEVRDAMADVLRFWLDRGVDGFRADVVHLIGKREDLRDDPPEVVGTPRAGFHDEPVTHGYLRELRTVLDSYPGDRAIVGEVNLRSSAAIAAYYGTGDELHMAFDFGLVDAPFDADAWRTRIDEVRHAFDPVDAWPTWVLSNHDQPRHRTRYGSLEAAEVAATVLLTLRGTPFLYQGEELGLEDADVPEHRRVDPGGRDGCRAPIPWDDAPGHGWACDDPWMVWPLEADRRNVADLRADEGSILHLYRRLLQLRRDSPALHRGAFEWLEAPEGVLAYRRVADDDERVVVANLGAEPADVRLEGDRSVALATDRDEDRPFDGRVPPTTAYVLSSPQR